MSLSSSVRDRLVCSAHRGAAGFPVDADQVIAALTMGIGRPGRLLRSLIYGTTGVISVARHRHELSGQTPIMAAMLTAARTGCDIRDFRSLRRNHIGSPAHLHRIVPRPRRREHREWNNCAVGAGLVNDKGHCNRVVGDGGLPVPEQHRIDTRCVVTASGPNGSLVLHGSGLEPGRPWVLKGRLGLQGDAIWLAASSGTAPAGRGESELSGRINALIRAGQVVAEEFLEPAAWFRDQGDTALPTIRVVTSKLSGTTESLGMVLFRGNPGAIVVHRRAGGIAHPLLADGTWGRGADKDGRLHGTCDSPVDDHMRSELERICVRAHDLFPCVGTIGWDVGWSSRGFFLLEGNPNWGMDIPQFLPGRPLLGHFRASRFRETW
jgi:hypothetical protein